MTIFDGNLLWQFLMTIIDDNFLMTIFDDNYWWKFLMEYLMTIFFDDNFSIHSGPPTQKERTMDGQRCPTLNLRFLRKFTFSSYIFFINSLWFFGSNGEDDGYGQKMLTVVLEKPPHLFEVLFVLLTQKMVPNLITRWD